MRENNYNNSSNNNTNILLQNSNFYVYTLYLIKLFLSQSL